MDDGDNGSPSICYDTGTREIVRVLCRSVPFVHLIGWHESLDRRSTVPIHLAHDFQQVETLPENDRTRYTITPAARKELLTRLLKLNHQRAAEETASQATQTQTTKSSKAKKPQRAKQEDELL